MRLRKEGSDASRVLSMSPGWRSIIVRTIASHFSKDCLNKPMKIIFRLLSPTRRRRVFLVAQFEATIHMKRRNFCWLNSKRAEDVSSRNPQGSTIGNPVVCIQ
jgi:hypothetical protein